MAKLYRTETTLQDILNMKVGDELKLSGGDLPDYTEEDAGKALVVNQSGTGVEWGSELPPCTSSDEKKVLTVTEGETHYTYVTLVPEQSVEGSQQGAITGINLDVVTALMPPYNVRAYLDGVEMGGSASGGGEWPVTITGEGTSFIVEIKNTDGEWAGTLWAPQGTHSIKIDVQNSVTNFVPSWETIPNRVIESRGGTLQMTWEEINEALSKGPLYVCGVGFAELVLLATSSGNNFYVYTAALVESYPEGAPFIRRAYFTNSLQGYPMYQN